MIEDLKRRFNRIKRDNKGSAIVLVIVALAMVGILAMTIMWMSMTNYYMKSTDKGNKMGFYSAETILEQIKAGLEEDASYAAARAYAFVLTKDYSADSTADRDYEFKKAYQNYFVERVADPSDASKGTYSLSYLLDFVDSAAGVSLSRASSGRIRYLSSADPKFIHSYSSDLMKLEGLHLEYTEQGFNGGEYVSVIDTDIIIMVPDISFTQTSILPDVFEYALVADKKLENTNIGTTEIDGNIYAGEEGIDLLSKFKIKYTNQNSGRLISKGNVRIGMDSMSASDTVLDISTPGLGGKAEFWASDIVIGKGSKLNTINTDTYVADDLTLSGRKSKVIMKGDGSFYGYGCGDKSDESSAIVVNGIGSEVDIKELDKVMLLGRAYVSIPNRTIDISGGTPVIVDYLEDFAMGESLAVKGEQVAFLMPDECLKYVETISGNKVKRNMPNPFISSDFPDDSKIEASLSANGIDLGRYVTGWKPIVRPHGDSGLGYVYMKMEGEKANEYYRAYYKNNKDKLDNYYLVYAGKDKVVLPQSTDLASEGNLLTALYADSSADPADPGNPTDADGIIKNTNSQLYKAIPEADKLVINDDLTQKKNNLCAKLIKEGATTTELSNTLFDNLILRQDVINLVNRNGNPYIFEATAADGHKNYAVFAKNDTGTPYVCNDDSIRVLVVVGDVEVDTDFTGLLIASGKVTIKGSHTIKSIVNATDDEMQELRDTLQKEQSIDYLPTVSAGSLPRIEDRTALQYFRDGSGYALDGLGGSGGATVSRNSIDFTELVKFNNWVKN